ncbi:MAG TPA: hypothetical protein VG246_11100 [Acidimicrobiales bacterium]|nr:hypothetical protein [Acidimicrobiales bacterium]
MDEELSSAVPAVTAAGSWATFWRDLRWSFRSWASGSSFVLLTAVVAILLRLLLGEASGLYWIGYLALLGFPGTQRIFYLREYKAERFSLIEVLTLTKRFTLRFFRLGLVLIIPTGVATIIAIVVVHGWQSTAHNSALPLRVRIAELVVVFLIDALLTFVTPALVFSTGSAVEALKIGFRTLRSTWPSSAWYVFTPGLTMSALVLVLPTQAVNVTVGVVISVAGAMLAFGFRGAVVPYYLRRIGPVGDDGAA